MKWLSEPYKISKTKYQLKKTNLCFLFLKLPLNKKTLLKLEQTLNVTKLNCTKLVRRTVSRVLRDSIYKNIKQLTNGTLIFGTPIWENGFISKTVLLNNFNNLSFVLTILKLNNKLYSINQFNYINLLNYIHSKTLLCQFLITNLKFHLSNKI